MADGTRSACYARAPLALTMQPQDFRKLVRKWALPVIALTALGAVVAFGVSKAMTPVYQATGNVLVVAGLGQSANSLPADLNISAAEATTTAATLMTTPPLLRSVINSNHLGESETALATNVTATPQTNSELVDVTVTDPSPNRAAQIANAIMSTFAAEITKQNTDRINQAGASLQAEINQVQNTLNQDEQQLAAASARQDTTALRQTISDQTALLTQLTLNYSTFRASQEQNLETVSVATPASAPAAPSSPRTVLNVALGAVAGLLVALGMAALLEYLDQGLKTAEDVRRRLGIPCLGVVPRYPGGGRRGGHRQVQILGAKEAYRRLRANLLFASPDAELRTIVVTSARSGEGKTQTAANLAIALAGADKHILLIDGDMRRPDLHRMFSKPLQGGMSEMIMEVQRGEVPTLNGAHVTSHAGLSLITSGTIPPNPSELLSSKRSMVLLRSLEKSFDMVVIDTPPVDAVPDALSLAAEGSGTVVVVEAGRTNAAQAAAVVDALNNVGANVLGVVLNKARERRGPDYYYYYKYAGAERVPHGQPAGLQRPPVRVTRGAR